MSSLTILENSANMLVAEQSPPSALFFGLVSTLVATAFAVVMLLQRRWVLGVLMLVLAGGLCLLALPGAAYKVTVDRNARTVTWEASRSGQVEAHGQVSASALQSADFDFNRNARNILLTGRDGKQYFPLGSQHFTGEPEQSVVLAAIRELIGQDGSSTPGPQQAK